MKEALRGILIIILITANVIINGCTKKGTDGEPGKDGSANVTAHTFSVPTWTNNGSRWYNEFPISELTTDNINSAAVQVYWGTTANNWVAVPYTYVGTVDYFMGYLAQVGNVEVRWTYNGAGVGSDPNSVLGGTVQIKVVIIPPAMIKPNVNLNNYNEVKDVYNIQ